jgi:hypothetical protein
MQCIKMQERSEREYNIIFILSDDIEFYEVKLDNIVKSQPARAYIIVQLITFCAACEVENFS